MEAGAVLTATELVADGLLKQYTIGGNKLLLYGGLAGYAGLGGVLLYFMQRGDGLALSNAYWDGFSGILTAVLAITFLGESLTMQQWFGICLVGFGLLIL